MTKHILFAAEADRIQDLLFRSSRLREVVGGSGLVTEFCEKVKEDLMAGGQWSVGKKQILVCHGGAFRILFPADEANVKGFGRALADAYFATTGGTLSVATEFPEIEEEDPKSFEFANKQSHLSLREAKAIRVTTSGTAQLPVTGVCASCGTGLAIRFQRLDEKLTDEQKNYACRQCLAKASEKRRSEFLKPFEKRVQKKIPFSAPSLQCTWRPERIGVWDPRGYVAYLKADGNSFGKLFQSCSSASMLKKLSKKLTKVLWKSLAVPAAALVDELNLDYSKRKFDQLPEIPILPLIAAGDECFLLLPAPWALDFAGQFCAEFQTRMAGVIQELELPDVDTPTLCASVVICKANYPHKLAHRRAERMLASAKRHFRQTEAKTSLINFEVVKGSSMLAEESADGRLVGSLQPYGVEATTRQLVRLDALLTARNDLGELRNTRLNALRELFDDPPASHDLTSSATRSWYRRLHRILERIQRMESTRDGNTDDGGVRKKLESILSNLGNGEDNMADIWLSTKRDGRNVFAHGFPDLLEIWRFARRINGIDQNNNAKTATDEATVTS